MMGLMATHTFLSRSEAPSEASEKSTAMVFESLFLSLYRYPLSFPIPGTSPASLQPGPADLCSLEDGFPSEACYPVHYTGGRWVCRRWRRFLHLAYQSLGARKGMETLRCDISCIIPSYSSWDHADKDSVGDRKRERRELREERRGMKNIVRCSSRSSSCSSSCMGPKVSTDAIGPKLEVFS